MRAACASGWACAQRIIMNTWSLPVAVVLASLTLFGCRSNRGDLDAMRTELRTQDDEIYRLEGYTREWRDLLKQCQTTNAQLEKELTKLHLKTPPRNRGGAPPAPFLPDVEIPDVEIPGVEFPSADGTPLDGNTASTIEGVNEITLNRLLTGGIDSDGQLGDEGISVVIETRDARGIIINEAGEVSIVLLDLAAETEEQARFARWKFSKEEAAEKFQDTALGQGIRFDLPWPENPPENHELKLFVRMTTDDGRELIVERALDVDLLGRAAAKRPPLEDTEQQATTPQQLVPQETDPLQTSRSIKPRRWAPSLRPPARAEQQPIETARQPREIEPRVRVPQQQNDRSTERPPVRTALQRPEWKPYR